MFEARGEKQSALFAKFLDGDEDAMLGITEMERPYLYAYLLRMTGLVDRSVAGCDESIRAVMASAESIKGLRTLVAKLYSTARNFCADVWNADASELLNEGFDEGGDKSEKRWEMNSEKALKSLDRNIQKFAGADREIIILRGIVGFSDVELAAMFGSDLKMVSERIEKILELLASRLDVEPLKAWEMMGMLPLHPLPGAIDAKSTQALSQMIGEVNRSSKGIFSKRKLLLAVAAITALFVLFYLKGLTKR
jgi:DNA-directed RNA polymerase specialized sigma24 family protein